MRILEQNGIPLNCINRIFADTDILTNPRVTKGYRALLQKCPSEPQILIRPPQNFIADNGKIQTEKYSPDDFIVAGDTMDIVLKQRTKIIHIESIEQYHQNIAKVIYVEQEVKIQNRGTPNRAAIDWLHDQLAGRLMYLSETAQFFYYNNLYWDVFDARTLLDQILSKASSPYTYPILEGALKLVAPKFLKTQEEIHNLFSLRNFIGFKNGTWDLAGGVLRPHAPENFLTGLLPINKKELTESAIHIEKFCPKICAWLIDRANGSEIYANILLAFIWATILGVTNPQRFLFLTGYSATGKSTYIRLLEYFVPPNKKYSGRAETLTSNFGLQDLTGVGKNLITFHDLGGRVSEHFVNLLRNLVSSGESLSVTRKYQSTAAMHFDGILVAASNKNPFNSQQREGILDRRMVYVPFVNRVTGGISQDFENLFPEEELNLLAAFALQLNGQLILKFIQTVNQIPLVRQNMLEAFQENPKSRHLQNFINKNLAFVAENWIPLGSTDDKPSAISLFGAYLHFTEKIEAAKTEIFSFAAFRQELLPLINSLHPSWQILERRRLSKAYNQKRVAGILNLQIKKVSPLVEEPEMDLSEYRADPFWLKVADERPSGDQSADGRSMVAPQSQKERWLSDNISINLTVGRVDVDEISTNTILLVIEALKQWVSHPRSLPYGENFLYSKKYSLVQHQSYRKELILTLRNVLLIWIDETPWTDWEELPSATDWEEPPSATDWEELPSANDDFDARFPLANHWIFNIIERSVEYPNWLYTQEEIEDRQKPHYLGKTWGVLYKPKNQAKFLIPNPVTLQAPLSELQKETLLVLEELRSIINNFN